MGASSLQNFTGLLPVAVMPGAIAEAGFLVPRHGPFHAARPTAPADPSGHTSRCGGAQQR
jgi:hypothetical protein